MNSNREHFRNALNVILTSGFIVVGCVALVILLLVRPTIKTNPEVRKYRAENFTLQILITLLSYFGNKLCKVSKSFFMKISAIPVAVWCCV